MAFLPDYAELYCLSNFSFLKGASHPEELVVQAAALGYQAIAITDECSLAGVVRAHRAAKTRDIKLIIGSFFQIDPSLSLVLIAPDRAAYGQLSALISLARSQAKKGSYQLSRSDLQGSVPNCLALLVVEPSSPDEIIQWAASTFPQRAWLTTSLHQDGQDADRLAHCQALAEQFNLPVVASGAALMHRRGRRALQDTLTAIRLNRAVSTLGRQLASNGERHLKPRQRLARSYPASMLAETIAIAKRCTFSLDVLRYEYPAELVPAGHTPASWLRVLTERGAAQHWPNGVPAKVTAMIEHELELIHALNYEPYFLTVHDVVAFARQQNILCQGRGSAANSAVCFCLGITSVDPSRASLLFERFISRERNEPPDIDVDFEHDRREEVIQYIYRKYGRHRAALAATVICYREKSALRDVSKALGGNPNSALCQQLTQTLIGFPRHLSQHVGGFVISRGPLSELVPTENAAMAGRSIIQWDKDDLESLGLLKVDCLALGMLSAIHRCFDLIAAHYGRTLSLEQVPADDKAVYDMLCRADTVGVFQVESRAQMSMLPRLRPRSFYDLIIQISIVRPGPIQGDMVHPYLRRREGREAVSYPNAEVKAVLERTLGVPIFQEQVMQLVIVAAGFSPGEADQVRRAMAAWKKRGGLGHFRKRLLDGMAARGYASEFAERLYDQICGFGDYGFPESHAASFALLVYVSAWLKCHYPAAFTCALLNSQPMGFYAPAQLVADVRAHEVQVLPVDVRYSDWDCTLEPSDSSQPALRLGLRLIKGLGHTVGRRIMHSREHGAAFANVADLTHRAQLDRGALRALADAGALAGITGHRHQAWWQVLGVERPTPLLSAAHNNEHPPTLSAPTEAQDVVGDYRSMGLTLGRHPVALLREPLRKRGYRPASELKQTGHRRIARAAGLVINRQRPGAAKGVMFLTLEDETGIVNVVVWRNLAERHQHLLYRVRLLGVIGIWERRGDVEHLIAGRFENEDPFLGDLENQIT